MNIEHQCTENTQRHPDLFCNRKGVDKKQFSIFNFQSSIFTTALLAAVILTGCGYHTPYQRNSAGTTIKSVYLDVWPNPTNELDLETEIFRTLNYWFKKFQNIRITDDQSTADYILAGEIRALDRPALAYGKYDQAVEIKVKLSVSYQIRERRTNAILHEEKNLVFEEAAKTGTNAVTGRDNRRRALAMIVDDLAELISTETMDAIFPL
jgi:hypothetical protein